MGSFSYLEPVAASRPSQPRAMGDRTRQFAAHYAAERNCGHPHSNFQVATPTFSPATCHRAIALLQFVAMRELGRGMCSSHQSCAHEVRGL